MIKGIIFGAIGMYIYLVQPQWASHIIEWTQTAWLHIQNFINA